MTFSCAGWLLLVGCHQNAVMSPDKRLAQSEPRAKAPAARTGVPGRHDGDAVDDVLKEKPTTDPEMIEHVGNLIKTNGEHPRILELRYFHTGQLMGTSNDPAHFQSLIADLNQLVSDAGADSVMAFNCKSRVGEIWYHCLHNPSEAHPVYKSIEKHASLNGHDLETDFRRTALYVRLAQCAFSLKKRDEVEKYSRLVMAYPYLGMEDRVMYGKFYELYNEAGRLFLMAFERDPKKLMSVDIYPSQGRLVRMQDDFIARVVFGLVELDKKASQPASAPTTLPATLPARTPASGNADEQITKAYDVDGSADEVAEMLNKMVAGMTGWVELTIRSSPATNQIIVTCSPGMHKATEEWLPKLEREPVRPKQPPASQPATPPATWPATVPARKAVEPDRRGRIARMKENPGAIAEVYIGDYYPQRPASIMVARKRLPPEAVPVLQRMLNDLEWASYRESIAATIGQISHDPSSVPVLLDYVRSPADWASLDHEGRFRAITARNGVLQYLGLIGGTEAVQALRTAITREGATALVQRWHTNEHVASVKNSQQIIDQVQGWAAVGLVFTQDPENLAILERMRQNAPGSFADALIVQRIIEQHGFDKALEILNTPEGVHVLANTLKELRDEGRLPKPDKQTHPSSMRSN